MEKEKTPIITTTYSEETCTTNVKIAKLIQLIAWVVKHLLEKKQFDFIEKSEIEKSIFKYYIDFPFNNILHFDLNKILEPIILSKNEVLIKKFFVENKSFDEILLKVIQDYQSIELGKHQFNCYIGHIKGLFHLLLNENVDQNVDNPLWESFVQDFFNPEQSKEDKIFKEIDFNEQNEQFEPTFEFSIQDLQHIYKEYLQLPSGSGEDIEDQNDGELEELQGEEQDGEHEEEEQRE